MKTKALGFIPVTYISYCYLVLFFLFHVLVLFRIALERERRERRENGVVPNQVFPNNQRHRQFRHWGTTGVRKKLRAAPPDQWQQQSESE